MTTEDKARPVTVVVMDKTLSSDDGFMDFAPHPIAANTPEEKTEEANEDGASDPKDSSAVSPADTSPSLTLVNPENEF